MHVVEHNFLTEHFGSILSGIILIAGGLIAWVFRIERRQTKSIINEQRLTALEKRFDAALKKADSDHDKIKLEIDQIRNTVQKTREDVAAIKAILSNMKK